MGTLTSYRAAYLSPGLILHAARFLMPRSIHGFRDNERANDNYGLSLVSTFWLYFLRFLGMLLIAISPPSPRGTGRDGSVVSLNFKGKADLRYPRA